MRELHFIATVLVWTVLSSAALAEPIDNPSTPKAAGRYDIAAFYWPSLHYDERWAEFFPGGGTDGEWLAIFYDAPGGDSTSHMRRHVGLAWLDLPLRVPQ